MYKSILFIFIIGSTCTVLAQAKPIIVFDLLEQTTDTIPAITYDETVENDATNHFQGIYNSTISDLILDVPTSDVFPESNFTRKKQAALDFDLSSFPIRTSVKIEAVINGINESLCSGSLISRKHVLTAAHCVSPPNTNELTISEMVVAPVFDESMLHPEFGFSHVTKVYFFKDWSFSGEDFAVLELDEEIGIETGWIGIGFNNNDDVLNDEIFYKFTYPAISLPDIDPNSYNGDTLYYNYGLVDVLNPNIIGIGGASGIPGESGSSIISVSNNEAYTSFGVLSFSGNLSHSRINDWRFYSLKYILELEGATNSPSEISANAVLVYPNPTSQFIHVKSAAIIVQVDLIGSNGQSVHSEQVMNQTRTLDLSDLASGVYLLKTTTQFGVQIDRFIIE